MFKRILWLIFLFPIFLPNVHAEVYYSKYEPTLEILEESDMVKKEDYNLYRYYEVDGTEYKLYDGTVGNNCKDIPGNWQNERKEITTGITEEERDMYRHKVSMWARYIYLTDLQGSYGALRITELNVKARGNDINYTYECDGCLEGFDEYINNGIWDENQSYIKNGGSLIIDLGKIYPVNQIEITLYLFDLGSDTKTFTISFTEQKKFNFAEKTFDLNFSDIHWSNAKKITYDYNDFEENDWYYYNITHQKTIDDSVLETEKYGKQYRYVEKWCYYDVKKYIDGYYETKPTLNAIQDSEYITESRYYKRDKIEIVDDIVIDSYNKDLNDFIIYSSTDYEFVHEIDENKNGEYDLTIKTPYTTINKKVIVANDKNIIKEQELIILNLQEEINNHIKTIEELNNKITNYQKEINKLMISLEDCNSCLDDCKNELNTKINEYKEEIKNLNNQINSLNESLQSKNELLLDYQKQSLENKEEIKNLNEQIVTLINELNLSKEELNSCLNNLNILEKEYQKNIDKKDKEIAILKENEQDIINSYEDALKQVKDNNKAYLNKINELLEIVDKLNLDIKELVKHEQEITSNYKDEIATLNLNIENLTKENDKLKNNSKEQYTPNYLLAISKDDLKNNWYLLLLFMVLVIMLFIQLIKNKSK